MVVSESLVPISGFAAKDLPYRLQGCVWFWNQEFWSVIATDMELDKLLNLSMTYFPICTMRLIIIFAYFTKVLEE